MYLPETLVEEETRASFLYPEIERSQPNHMFVELGTFLGGNLVRCVNYAKEANKQIKFYGIDHYLFDNIGQHTLDTITGYANYYDAFIDNLKKSDCFDDVTVIVSETKQAASRFPDKSIDTLFIDDGHNYPHTKEVLQLWLPKMKIGGCISGHDVPCDGVRQAICEMFQGEWRDNHHSYAVRVTEDIYNLKYANL